MLWREEMSEFRNVILQGHALDRLRELPDGIVQTCVTSPPYWGLRNYGTEPVIWDTVENCEHLWEENIKRSTSGSNKEPGLAGGRATQDQVATRQDQYLDFCTVCGAWRGSYGLEPTPELYVKHTVQIFHEIKRTLSKDGTLWINLGDSYWGGKGSNGNTKARETAEERGYTQSKGTVQDSFRPADGRHDSIKPKDLVGIPWMVAFALRADGWYLRSDIIWSKPNPMPESVTDRPTKAHEYIFLLSKSQKYYYDADAIKEQGTLSSLARLSQDVESQIGSNRVPGKTNGNMKAVGKIDKQRGHGRRHTGFNDRWDLMNKEEQCSLMRNKRSVWTVATQPYKQAHFATFPMDLITPCILAGSPEGGLVLDPFSGSGTTAAVAKMHNRDYLGFELNPEYIKLADKRLACISEHLFAPKSDDNKIPEPANGK